MSRIRMKWSAVAAVVVAFTASAQARDVVLQPLGPVAPEVLQAMKAAIEARVNATVRVEAPRLLPESAYYAPRRRYRAEKLLQAIDAAPPPGAWKVVAVTDAEISTTKGPIEDWGIAGLGTLNGPSCVVSTFLYRKHSPSQAVMLRRFADVTVHELGHTLGMDHCETKGCVMSDAKGKAISSADQSSGQYCDACRSLAPPGVLRPRPPAPDAGSIATTAGAAPR